MVIMVIVKVKSHDSSTNISFIKEFNAKIRKMYSDYSRAIAENRYEYAIKLGTGILRELLKVVREHVISSLKNTEIRGIVEDILAQHEKNLGYVEGIEEAVNEVPPLYSYEMREKAITTLSSSIQELFSFILGALMVITDLYFNTSTSIRAEGDSSQISFV